MTRETSMAAYHAAVDSGAVRHTHAHLMAVVASDGPMTASEAFQTLRGRMGGAQRFDSNTHARFTELRDRGLIVEVGTRPCSITGATVILWDIATGQAPAPRVRRHGFQEQIADLRAEVDALRAEVAGLKNRGQGELFR